MKTKLALKVVRDIIILILLLFFAGFFIRIGDGESATPLGRFMSYTMAGLTTLVWVIYLFRVIFSKPKK